MTDTTRNEILNLDNKELAKMVTDAVKRHVPNIDIPIKYHCIVEALPMIYAEGMKDGYDIAKASMQSKLDEANAKIAELINVMQPFSELLHEHHRTVHSTTPVFAINGSEITCGDLRKAKKLFDELTAPIVKEGK